MEFLRCCRVRGPLAAPIFYWIDFWGQTVGEKNVLMKMLMTFNGILFELPFAFSPALAVISGKTMTTTCFSSLQFDLDGG